MNGELFEIIKKRIISDTSNPWETMEIQHPGIAYIAQVIAEEVEKYIDNGKTD